jgi:hypothetical protein
LRSAHAVAAGIAEQVARRRESLAAAA